MPEPFTVNLERIQDYEFKTTFDWEHVAPVILDEPEPLGHSRGPNASRILAAAVGNCLSASLLFCLQKAQVPVHAIKTKVTGEYTRNERGRLRVGKLNVEIRLEAETEQEQRVNRCLSLFEDYCVVTASVRQGIEVNVCVVDGYGNVLFEEKGNPQ